MIFPDQVILPDLGSFARLGLETMIGYLIWSIISRPVLDITEGSIIIFMMDPVKGYRLTLASRPNHNPVGKHNGKRCRIGSRKPVSRQQVSLILAQASACATNTRRLRCRTQR